MNRMITGAMISAVAAIVMFHSTWCMPRKDAIASESGQWSWFSPV